MSKKKENPALDLKDPAEGLPAAGPAPQQAVSTVKAPHLPASLPATDAAAAGMLGLIERLAENPDVDVTKMTALLDMQERIWNRQAETAFNQDFALLSQALPRIKKRGSVAYDIDKNDKSKGQAEAFKFAKFEDIDLVVRPLLEQFGFTLSFTTDPRDGGGMVVHGVLAHKGGHSRKTSLPLALDGGGGKNNLQGMGSTASYGRRYATCILLNIITEGEDTDGNGAKIEIEEAARIDQLIDSFPDVAEYKPRFLKYMKVENITDILVKDHQKAQIALGEKEKAILKKQLEEKEKN